MTTAPSAASAAIDLVVTASIAQPGPATSRRLEGLVRGGIDWATVIATGTAHGVLPLVDARLREAAVSVPRAFEDTLGAAIRANAAWNLQLAGALLRLHDALAADGVRAIAWKGPALSLAVHGHVAMRMPSDLDLLVRPEDCARAARTLSAAGLTADARFADLRVWSFSGAGGLVVEVHWAPMPWRFAAGLGTRDLELETLSLANSRISHPAPADLLVLLALHGTKHRWHRLGWVSDVAHLLAKRPDLDWERARWLAADAGAIRAVALALNLVEVMSDGPLPAPASGLAAGPSMRVTAQRLVSGLFDRAPGPPRGMARVEDAAFQLRLKERRLDRLRYVVGLALGLCRGFWAGAPPAHGVIAGGPA